MTKYDDILTLQKRVAEFGDKRDWKKFHSPKNISMALTVEASELLEIFQWMTEEESQSLSEKDKEKATLELADIFLYTLLCAESIGVDLHDAAKRKIAINEHRFPKPDNRSQ